MVTQTRGRHAEPAGRLDAHLAAACAAAEHLLENRTIRERLVAYGADALTLEEVQAIAANIGLPVRAVLIALLNDCESCGSITPSDAGDVVCIGRRAAVAALTGTRFAKIIPPTEKYRRISLRLALDDADLWDLAHDVGDVLSSGGAIDTIFDVSRILARVVPRQPHDAFSWLPLQHVGRLHLATSIAAAPHRDVDLCMRLSEVRALGLRLDTDPVELVLGLHSCCLSCGQAYRPSSVRRFPTRWWHLVPSGLAIKAARIDAELMTRRPEIPALWLRLAELGLGELGADLLEDVLTHGPAWAIAQWPRRIQARGEFRRRLHPDFATREASTGA
jgi:hypothetical protein